MENEFDLIIGGYGIGARCLLRELAISGDFKNKKILVLKKGDWFSPCSVNTTSVVCLSGVQKGISPLGDLIYDSYELAKEYLEETDPSVCEIGVQYNLTDQSEFGAEDFKRRFGSIDVIQSFNDIELSKKLDGKIFKAFFVNPSLLLDSLEQSYIKSLNITFKEEPLLKLNLDNKSVKTISDEYSFGKLFLALGAHFEHFKQHFKNTDLAKSKIVSGSYLIYQNIDWGERAFSIARKHNNLVYRAREKTLMVGGSTVKENIQAQSYSELKDQLEGFKAILPSDFVLPEFSDFEIRTGLRHKGRKRTPFFGILDEKAQVYGMSGLYKNGFSFPFLGAKTIAKDLI